jgi:chemotaxis protein methyltransferase CheR
MQDSEFAFLAGLLKQRSGMSLTKDKQYLLETRLLPVARNCGYSSLEELISCLKQNPTRQLLVEVTEAMTTNESMFFRDQKPFAQLKNVIIPHLRKIKPSGPLRIWSAACSSGQEPYSVAMTLNDMPQAGAYSIIATDIDTTILQKASEGKYTQFEIQRGLPIQLLLKNFEQVDGNHWKVKDSLKKNIEFRAHNLLENFSSLGKFDLIMCRNVLIYFDNETKSEVLEKLAGALEPHGRLMLGSAETIISFTDKLKPFEQERGIFMPNIS